MTATTRYFSPATGTWHDDLVDASAVIAEKTKEPKCYAHLLTPDVHCPMCRQELDYLKRKRLEEKR